ncbi:MAG: hypothetical protein KAR14_11905 [Candidatus Aminicenantes bacterium]|nr:hypothetical protein [Candidatus Aminicenantes bacterium]
MKRGNLPGLFTIILILVIIPGRMSAIGPLDIYFQGGAITDDSFSFSPLLWTAGINLDFKTGSMLMISPELNIIVNEFDFDFILLEPALTINFRLANFFVGAGLTKFFELGDDFWANKFSLKVHGGLKLIGVKLRAYMVIPFDELFKPTIYGGSIGFGF